MASISEMVREMPGHAIAIESDEDALFALRPSENGYIVNPERQRGRVANPHNVERINPHGIMPLDHLPQNATLILIEQEPDGHDQLGSLGHLLSRSPPLELFHARPIRSCCS